jgi:hypothetical protein
LKKPVVTSDSSISSVVALIYQIDGVIERVATAQFPSDSGGLQAFLQQQRY